MKTSETKLCDARRVAADVGAPLSPIDPWSIAVIGYQQLQLWRDTRLSTWSVPLLLLSGFNFLSVNWSHVTESNNTTTLKCCTGPLEGFQVLKKAQFTPKEDFSHYLLMKSCFVHKTLQHSAKLLKKLENAQQRPPNSSSGGIQVYGGSETRI